MKTYRITQTLDKKEYTIKAYRVIGIGIHYHFLDKHGEDEYVFHKNDITYKEVDNNTTTIPCAE